MPTQNISLGEYVQNVERSVRLSGDRVATWMFYVSTIIHYQWILYCMTYYFKIAHSHGTSPLRCTDEGLKNLNVSHLDFVDFEILDFDLCFPK